MDCRIGIIGDGQTDYRVIGRLVECILNQESEEAASPQIIELRRQRIRDAVDAYWRAASKSNDYSISGKAGSQLLNSTSRALLGAVYDFEVQVKGEYVSWRDVIVLSTDAEHHLATPETYFDAWSVHFPKILMFASEVTYHQLLAQGYSPSIIPTIVPLPLYPSTDIIVAAARENGISVHGQPAQELKMKLYNSPDLRMLSSEDFERRALSHLTTDSVEQVFNQIPECRIFIHSLLGRGLFRSDKARN